MFFPSSEDDWIAFPLRTQDDGIEPRDAAQNPEAICLEIPVGSRGKNGARKGLAVLDPNGIDFKWEFLPITGTM